MTNIKTWLKAFRLRTLPLAFSCILLGSFLAGEFLNPIILCFALLTTLFLQILSNLANDYGDYTSGTDNENRVGPQRTLQAGLITKAQMKTAIIIFSVLSLTSGIYLIKLSLGEFSLVFALFVLLGLAAIAAAIKYTMGKNPYGYSGYGDVFVFLFFGIVGVGATYYLHTQTLNWNILFPASSIGFLSSGVLNLNNLRDIENDRASNKNTLVVKLGLQNGKRYHRLLLIMAVACFITFNILQQNTDYKHYIYFILLFFLGKHLKFVMQNNDPQKFNPELKKLALTTLLFSLLYGIPFIL